MAATEQAAASYSLTAGDALAAARPEAALPEQRGILRTARVHAGVAALPRLLPW